MPPHDPIQDPDHLLPPRKKSSGPFVGTIIILIVLIVGGLYFATNRNKNAANQVPYIPSGTTTLPTITSTTSAAQ